MILRTAKFLAELKRNQWKTKEQIEKIQLSKLKKIIAHAYNTVPYYNALFKQNNLHPSDIKELSDLEKIPITTKKDLIKCFPGEIVSNNVDISKCSVEKTSGSSGIALKVFRSKEVCDYNLALELNAFFECGLKPSDNLLVFDDPTHFGSQKKSLLAHFGLMNKVNASIFEKSAKLTDLLSKIRPDMVYAYPSTMYLLSRYIKKNKLVLPKYPRFIVTSSELLSEKFRGLIEEQFKCPVYDHYGCTEFPRIAWQCKEKKHMHINADSYIVEFINDKKPVKNENGNITITSLYDFGMPLIRYSLNDISASVDTLCNCKRGLPLMRVLEGRKDDFLIDKKGDIISPKVLCFELDEIKSIDDYQVVQKKAGSAVIYAVKGAHYDSKEFYSGLKKAINIGNTPLSIKVVFLKKLKKDGKKMRRVRSFVIQPDEIN